MEIKIDRHSEVYSWSVTDDYGAVLEYGKESSREAAQEPRRWQRHGYRARQ